MGISMAFYRPVGEDLYEHIPSIALHTSRLWDFLRWYGDIRYESGHRILPMVPDQTLWREGEWEDIEEEGGRWRMRVQGEVAEDMRRWAEQHEEILAALEAHPPPPDLADLVQAIIERMRMGGIPVVSW